MMVRKKNRFKMILSCTMILGTLSFGACSGEEKADNSKKDSIQTEEAAQNRETETLGETETAAETEWETTEESQGAEETESTEETESAEETENTEETESEDGTENQGEAEPAGETQEPDVTPPVMVGVQNITVELGSNISYKKDVVVSDDSGKCTLTVDTGSVDLNTAGTYEVTYTATDEAGNSTSQTIVVTVINPPTVTREQVDELADGVIASVVTEDMTLLEQVKALWNWCRTQITYSYSNGERGVVSGAYEGLYNRKGDCYTYYATLEVLLDRLGVENMCVARVGGNSNHWWNLVNLGDGWYHCDSSPRHTGHKFRCFMQTDEQIAAYEEAYTKLFPNHPNYYTFESDLYPERATEIIVESSIP